MSENIGGVMQQGRNQAVKVLVSLAGVVVYVAGVVYAEVHGYSLLTKGIDPDMLIWAVIGIFALGITALALPLGLHFKFHAELERIAAFAFYAVDLSLMIGNAVIDYGLRTGNILPAWADLYRTWVIPTTPIIVALGWSLLWLLDPGQRELAMVEKLRASTREVLANRIAEQAKSASVEAEVDAAASQMVRDIVGAALSSSVAANRRTLPANTIDVQSGSVVPANGNGRRKAGTFLWPQMKASRVASGNGHGGGLEDGDAADPTEGRD